MAVSLKDRVNTLEVVLGEFIVQTNKSLNRMERGLSEFKDEMKEFKDEMKEFKDEMKEFKDEMKEFKDEMKESKDETRADRIYINKRWGELANKMGTIIEDIVAPNLPNIAYKLFGFERIDDFMIRRSVRSQKDPTIVKEFDIILAGKEAIIINETKSTINMKDEEAFVSSLHSVFDYIPEHKGKKIIPLMASLSVRDNIVKFLTRNKVYVLTMSGDTMEVINFDKIVY